MAALFSGPASSTGVRFTKKNSSSVNKQGEHSYSESSISPTSIVTSVMSAPRRPLAEDCFILDTGCSRDVTVPDRSYLDGEWCDDKQETMLAFDGHQVRSQGTGQWCRLPALVCASAPPLLNIYPVSCNSESHQIQDWHICKMTMSATIQNPSHCHLARLLCSYL